MMYKHIWLIKPLTNLHVGDENIESMGIVDKMIQRDALTTLPCIHSSSLKGALSEYVSFKKAESVKEIFGSDNAKPEESQKGSHTFFDAYLLFLPVPSSQDLYYRVTSLTVLRQFLDVLELFGFITKDKVYDNISELLSKLSKLSYNRRAFVFCNEEVNDLRIGDYPVQSLPVSSERKSYQSALEFLKGLGGENIAFLSDSDFSELCSDENLPIIARNKLDKGESKNLWYEQVVPRESVFYTVILEKGNNSLKDILDNKAVIQIGANATIGYGYCEFKWYK